MPEHITIEQLLDRSTGLPLLRAWLIEKGKSPTYSIYLDKIITTFVEETLGVGWHAVGMDIHPPNDWPDSNQRWHFSEWLDGVRRAIQDHWRFHRCEHDYPRHLLWRFDYYFNFVPPEFVYGVPVAVKDTGRTLIATILGKEGNTITLAILGDDLIYYTTWSNIKYEFDGKYTVDRIDLSIQQI